MSDRPSAWFFRWSIISGFIAFITGFAVGAEPSHPRDGGPSVLEKYLPSEKEIEGWKIDGAFQEFQGDDLFLYMDGGASLYQEYGFVRLLAQSYRSLNGRSLALEIFEMASPAAAFGIYTFKKSSQGTKSALGQEGNLEEYYLNFWKGHYLVTLTGFDGEKETIEGLKKIGMMVDIKIKETSPKPGIIRLLPEEGLLKSSLKYLKGHLGLFNIYPFSIEDVFRFKEGIKGDYSSNYSIFIIKYESPDESRKRFAVVKQAARKNSKHKDFRLIDDDVFIYSDMTSPFIGLNVFQQYIVIVDDRTSANRIKTIISKVHDRLQK